MGWYKVVGDESIQYVDESGQERRANVGSIVNIEVRTQAKRLKKAGQIVPLESADENIGADFVLREKHTDPAPAKALKSSQKETVDAEDGEDISIGALVQVGEEVGEIVKVNTRTVDVRFEEDEEPRRCKREDVEVIG